MATERSISISMPFFLLVLFFSSTSFAQSSSSQLCNPAGPRLQCPGGASDQPSCASAGCCWIPAQENSAVPWCFLGNGGRSEYEVVDDGFSSEKLSVPLGSSSSSSSSPLFSASLRQVTATQPELGEDEGELEFSVSEQCGVARLRLRAVVEGEEKGRKGAFELPPWLFASGLDACSEESSRKATEEGHGGGKSSSSSSSSSQATKNRIDLTVFRSPFSVEVVTTPSSSSAAPSSSTSAPTSTPLFNTTGHRLVFKRRYVELTTSLTPGSYLYGLGERSGDSLRVQREGGGGENIPPPPLAIWARDTPSWKDGGENLYGAWPAWIEVMPSGDGGRAHGAVLLSSSPVEAQVTEDSLSLRVLLAPGSALELALLPGPTPADVSDQMTRLLGRPALPPAFALGTHQSRWGYESVDALRGVVKGYEEARLPLEVVWSDIDYLDGFRDFTFDPLKYPVEDMRRFVSEELHARGKKWVPILDPGIKIEPGYAPYEAGKVATERPGATPDERVFIVVEGEAGGGRENNSRGNTNTSSSPPPPPPPPPPPKTLVPFVGTVWPGRVHYPDFLSLAARDFWEKWIEDLHALVPFDGLWIDMCEPSNFDDDVHEGGGRGEGGRGEERGGEEAVPLYPINNGGRRDPLSAKTVSVWAVGSSGSSSPSPSSSSSSSASSSSSSSAAFHIDTHNLYGHAEASATRQALVKVLAEERAKKKKRKEEEERSGGTVVAQSSSLSPLLSPPPPPPPTPRPFILARSSFLGLGAFAAHWTGDNAATWRDLGRSVSGILNSALFAGASLSGADVCGFSLDTTEHLCSRWAAAAAFQPFWRSHSDKAAAPQEPYLWPGVAAAARRALGVRYRLLPLLYSGLALSSESGQPLMRPLWYEWPGLEGAHENEDRSWVLGGGGGGGRGDAGPGGGDGGGGSDGGSTSTSCAPLFVAPPLRESDTDSVATWLPPGKWLDLWGLLEDALGLELEAFVPDDGRGGRKGGKRREKLPPPPSSSSSSHQKISIASFDGGEHGVSGFSLPTPPERAVALLQCQGSIVPLAWSPSSSSSDEKTEKDDPLLSVAAALRAPLALSVALECSSNNSSAPSPSCSALGALFVDDGETDSRGDWWRLRASAGARGGRVEAELVFSSDGVASSSSSSSDAAPLALPRHPPPRLRKVSISFFADGEEMEAAAVLFSGGSATSDLGRGEVVVVAAAVASSSHSSHSSSSHSSSFASAITFELPETPSFLDVGRRKSTASGASFSSSPVVTLVSWGDGGRAAAGGGGSDAGVAEA